MISWNYIFSGQDDFEMVTWGVGWCVKENESPKICLYKCKLVLPKIKSIDADIFSYVVAHKLCFKMIPVAKNLTI